MLLSLKTYERCSYVDLSVFLASRVLRKNFIRIKSIFISPIPSVNSSDFISKMQLTYLNRIHITLCWFDAFFIREFHEFLIFVKYRQNVCFRYAVELAFHFIFQIFHNISFVFSYPVYHWNNFAVGICCCLPLWARL